MNISDWSQSNQISVGIVFIYAFGNYFDLLVFRIHIFRDIVGSHSCKVRFFLKLKYINDKCKTIFKRLLNIYELIASSNTMYSY